MAKEHRILQVLAGVVLFLAATTFAQAQIGTPAPLSIGQSGSTSMTMFTGNVVPAGESIIVIAGATTNSTLPTGATCSDNFGNSYSTEVSGSSPTLRAIICSTHGLGAPLPVGALITVTWSGGSGDFQLLGAAFSISGLITAPLDVTGS